MKRAALGGATRGPVAPTRQRRTIRFIQILLVLFAIAAFVFAGYSWGRSTGYAEGARSGGIDAPSEPSAIQGPVLVVLGALGLTGAYLLSSDGAVRIPTPARLDELAGRAEAIALEKAEEASTAPSEARAAETRS